MFRSPPLCRLARSRIRVIFSFTALALVAGTLAPAPRAQANAPRNPEDLLIVDCLLPGQVRKLGANSMFLSARRPVRTSQSDCEIRGGEFVASDRANYQTALKVWQGQAEGGDADAQNYVGEIYLKGLGTEPDYAQAAQWFEKAAAQGSRRARINLGYMYEQGLGVSQDTARALNLYRDASGIAGDKLVFASAVTAEVKQAHAETQALREQLSSEQRNAEQLRAQLEKLQGELRRKQQTYDKSQRDLDDARRKLDGEQRKLGVESDPGFSKIKAELDAREKSLADRQRQLEAQKQSSTRQLDAAEAEVARLRDRERQSAGSASTANAREAAALREAKTRSETALAQARDQASELARQLEQNEQQRQEAQARFDGARMQLAQERAQNEDSTRLLKLMEGELREKRQQLASERNQLAALRAQIEQRPERVDATTAFTTASVGGGLRVEILQPVLSVTRGSGKPAASLLPAQNGMDVVGRVVAPAGLTTLSINDQTITADAAGNFTTHIAAAGDSTPVRVSALDRRGEKAVLDFVLLPPVGGNANAAAARALVVNTLPRGVQLGRFHALVIGNDSYQGYPALKGPVADANAVAALLKSHYGYETHVLTNANRFEILSALNDLREQLKEEDNLIVYYAGHGELDSSNQGYWLPVDARAEQPTSWISNRAVSDILTTMNAKHVLVIADSCYSGTMTRTSLATFGGMASDSWGDWVKTMVSGRSRTAMTSGGVQPVADTQRGEHSIFAGALIAALSDNNQLLTGQRLYREVAASMALKSGGAGLQQAPDYAPIQFAGHEAGEYFFMPKS